MTRWILALSLVLVFAAVRAAAVSIEDPGQGPVPVPGTGRAELSGIAWVGGDRWLAVADTGAQLVTLDVAIDATSGRITSVASRGATRLAGGVDLEGLAVRAGGSVLVADEAGSEIREHDPVSGERIGAVAVPRVFATSRKNLGLESLTASPDGRVFWTTTEAPLPADGSAAPGTGAWLRLQRFDEALRPDLQLGYRGAPFAGILGVTDLLALPDGGLLVLERRLGLGGFRVTLWAVDAEDATDTSEVTDLREGGFTPVSRRRVWESPHVAENFEGIALGPELAGGARCVLLVSDGGGTREPTLYALRLTL